MRRLPPHALPRIPRPRNSLEHGYDELWEEIPDEEDDDEQEAAE